MQVSNLFRQFVGANQTEKKQAAPVSPRSQAQSVNRAMQTMSKLSAGATFEGNVSSIKGDKVTLSLSNGSSVVARLSDEVSLSEGESVFFEVKSNDGNLINIRPISIGMMENPTILSALSAGGLAKNERNVSMVNAMMQEQLPIDTKSLGEMAKEVAMHPNADVRTLVTMQKVGLPITDSMIEQFENYKESEGAILDTVTDLVDNLAEAFMGDDVSAEDIATFGKNLMSILTTEEGVIPPLLDGDGNPVPIPEDAIPLEAGEADGKMGAAAAVEGVLPEEAAEPALSAEEGGVSQAAAPTEEAAAALPEEEPDIQVAQATADPSEAGEVQEAGANPMQSGSTSNGGIDALKDQIDSFRNALKNLEAPLEGEEALARGEAAASGRTGIVIESADQDADIQQILEQAPGQEDHSVPGTLGRVLNEADRSELSGMLKELDVPLERLVDENGKLMPEVGTKELAQAVTEYLSENHNLQKEDLIKLLSADPFKKVLKDVMSERWTLPPEKVADKEAVKNLYAKLSVDMERLSQVANEAAKGQNPISQAAQSIQNNVDFINQVNQAYTYIQLPLKLSGQQATGDLYVYSNKKGPIGENDELSAFLHFDLEHLGSTDISVKMKQKKVSTKFYLDDAASFDLIEKNLPVLQDKLEKLGYTVSLKASKGEEPVDFVEDFLKQDVAFGGDIRRYSFDMMA